MVGGLCILQLNELKNNKSAKTVTRSGETLTSRPDEDSHPHINTNRRLSVFFMKFHMWSHMLPDLNGVLIQAKYHADELHRAHTHSDSLGSNWL